MSSSSAPIPTFPVAHDLSLLTETLVIQQKDRITVAPFLRTVGSRITKR